MTFRASGGGSDGGSLGLLRHTALIAALVGAVVSVGLTLHAGRRNPSYLLKFIFALWVLSPFLALAWANLASRIWPVVMRATIFVLTLAITLGALVIYGAHAFGYLRAKTGFIFLVVPAASWLLIAIVVPIAAIVSAKRSH